MTVKEDAAGAFSLQKVIWFLIMPPASLILLMLLDAVISRKRRRTGKALILAASAYYMRRAVAMFTRQGCTVIQAPTYYLVQTRKITPALLIPRSSNLAHSSVALAESLSLTWWKLRGEI